MLLRVDIDFNIELKKAVPYLLSVFKEENVCATFFVVMGEDTLYKHFRRFKKKGYSKRVSSMKPFKILRHFGILPFLRGWVFPKGHVASAYPDILKRIIDEGHELAVHGYNHAYWAENCWNMCESELEEEIGRATETYRRLVNTEPTVWGSPNWRCSGKQLPILKKYGYRYCSEARGNYPAVPVCENNENEIPDIPINLPCTHELIQAGIRREQVAETIAESLSGTYNMLVIHGYYEGMLNRDLLHTLLRKLKGKDCHFTTISGYMASVGVEKLPKTALKTVRVPGGFGEISCHEEFLSNNYFAQLE